MFIYFLDFEQEVELRRRQVSKATKKTSSKSSYEIIDNDILIGDEPETQKKSSTNKATKRRVPKSTSEQNYRSNEVITRI